MYVFNLEYVWEICFIMDEENSCIIYDKVFKIIGILRYKNNDKVYYVVFSLCLENGIDC